MHISRPWASDCDALSKHGYDDAALYLHLSRLLPHRPSCAFVVVPDVPGDGLSTINCYEHYAPVLANDGFPLAYCLQDGAEHFDFPPCDVVFLAGTDDWREAQGAWLLQQAREAGLRTHVGRVNSARRVKHLAFCHADSCDGTYVGFRGVERGVREVGQWLSAAAASRLFGPGDLQATQLTEERVRSLRALQRRTAAPSGGPGTDNMPSLFAPAQPGVPWADLPRPNTDLSPSRRAS